MFWIGRLVLRADTTGFSGPPSNGPDGRRPRAMLMPWPRSVPPSAIIRYQCPPWEYRCGASGNFNPVPDHSEIGSVSGLPLSRSTVICRMPLCPPPKAAPEVVSRPE